MLHLHGIGKQYGSKVLFEGAEAHIGHRSRVALIGPNGAGKSTLIRIILGLESSDSGHVSRATHLSIGHLAQEVPKFSGRTVLEEVMRLGGRREDLLEAKSELEESFAKSAASEAELERYGRLLEELEQLDEYRLESRAKAILGGMGFRPQDFDRSLEEFSGGWLMRVALSRVLLLEPDLLLLDEPTNHLDLESLWLKEFLKGYRGALLLVSHDSAFLNRMVNEVLEVDQRKLWTYRGNLDAFAVQKQERLTVMRAESKGQQARIAELQSFIDRFGAKATKARQAQSRAKQLEKLEQNLIELPDDRQTVRFRFPPAPHSGREVVTARQAGMRYGEKVVFRDLDWVISGGSRVAIVGVNGAGKTTLLKLLAGELTPSSGMVKLGHEVKVGYYAQHQAESLNMGKTIVQELEMTAPHMPVAQVRAIAGAFLFTGDAVEKKCAVLLRRRKGPRGSGQASAFSGELPHPRRAYQSSRRRVPRRTARGASGFRRNSLPGFARSRFRLAPRGLGAGDPALARRFARSRAARKLRRLPATQDGGGPDLSAPPKRAAGRASHGFFGSVGRGAGPARDPIQQSKAHLGTRTRKARTGNHEARSATGRAA